MKNLLLLTALLGLLAWSGCKRCDDPSNPECRNYDPCYVQGPVSAEFSMWEKAGLGWPEALPIHRSVSARNRLILRAEQELDSYEWYIGDEAEPRTGPEVVVSFGWVPRGRIPIRLIARGEPNLACDPDDDGIDTVDKEVFVLDFEDLPIAGRYRGRHTHRIGEKPFEVEILRMAEWRYLDTTQFPTPPDYATMVYYVKNLPNGTPNAVKFNQTYGTNHTQDRIYRAAPLSAMVGAEGLYLPMEGSGNGWYGYAPEGYGYLSADYDSLTIHYTMLDSTLYWAESAQGVFPYVRTDTVTFIGIRQ